MMTIVTIGTIFRITDRVTIITIMAIVHVGRSNAIQTTVANSASITRCAAVATHTMITIETITAINAICTHNIAVVTNFVYISCQTRLIQVVYRVLVNITVLFVVNVGNATIWIVCVNAPIGYWWR